MQPLTLRTFAGALTILLSSSIASSEGKNDGGISGNCPADIAPAGGNGTVDVDDLLMVINHWGACATQCPPACAGDINGSCQVDVDDLLAVINAWGVCPSCRPDNLEPNDGCPGLNLGTLESNRGTASVLGANLSPAGDTDRYYFFVDDTGSCFQDFIKVHVTLTVPSGSDGTYLVCGSMHNCPPTGTPEVCHNVAPGSSFHFVISWLDECTGDDSRFVLLRIRQNTPVTDQCEPYELQIFVDEES